MTRQRVLGTPRGPRSLVMMPVSVRNQPAEREADRMAERTATRSLALDRVRVHEPDPPGGTIAVEPSVPKRLEARRGHGHALPPPLRSEMEGKLGADLSRVRVHSDHEAHALSGQLEAQAFTYGTDVYLHQSLGGTEGRRVLAHELVHTLQQRRTAPTVQRSSYTTVPKDGLSKVARRFGVTVKGLARANGLSETAGLEVGQFLIIPDGIPFDHTVVFGDTLFSLARKFQVPADDIKRLNGLTSNTIRLGSVLRIPVTNQRGGASPPPSPPPEPVPQPPAPAPQPPVPVPQPPTPAPQPHAPAAAPQAPAPQASAPVPQAPTPATPAAPTVAPSASTRGHDPGRDYAGGTVREKSLLRKADLRTLEQADGKDVFFLTGTSVKLVSTSGDWIFVEGEAVVQDSGNTRSVGVRRGFIMRRWTDMTLGVFKNLDVQDLTPTFGKLVKSRLESRDVKFLTLHRTDAPTGQNTLNTYQNRMAGRERGKEHVAAQYLIDEAGTIHAVAPIDQLTFHVGEMKDRKPGFQNAGSEHSIGIEHTGTPLVLPVPTSARDKTKLKANRDAIKAAAMAPEFKASLLALSDRKLAAKARANKDPHNPTRWNVYGDINAEQKRSTFLLETRLMQNFGLRESQLIPHEESSAKAPGEGQNIKEFMIAARAYQVKVTEFGKALQADPKLGSDPTLTAILQGENNTLRALNLDKTDSELGAMAAEKAAGTSGPATQNEVLRTLYYEKFWQRHQQLDALIGVLKTTGSSDPAKLTAITAKWVR